MEELRFVTLDELPSPFPSSSSSSSSSLFLLFNRIIREPRAQEFSLRAPFPPDFEGNSGYDRLNSSFERLSSPLPPWTERG